jgi:hypothetical protein
MSPNPPIPCRLEVTKAGWWLSFPLDPRAGLLLFDPDEKSAFLADRDLSIAEATTKTLYCSQEQYEQACYFPPPF